MTVNLPAHALDPRSGVAQNRAGAKGGMIAAMAVVRFP